MVRLIFAGVVALSLAVFVCAAPQDFNGRGVQHQQQQQPNPQQYQVNGSNSVKTSAYKNNTREGGKDELFGYPENPSAIESKQNARNRTPVFIPNRCDKNEILYPGDQETDWVCDCKPTFVYHPQSRQCYQLFTQGYCEGSTMLTLPKGAKHAECVLNRCHQEGADMVEFDRTCVKLNDYHQKCQHGMLKQLIGVREDTNELACINISDVVGVFNGTTAANVMQQDGYQG